MSPTLRGRAFRAEGQRVSTLHGELLDALAVLLARAQRTGAVLDDLTAPQVKALLIGVVAGSEWLGGTEQDRRHLIAVVCDGLRRLT